MPNGEEESKKSRKEVYEDGYNDAIKDFTDIKDKCIQFYTEGFKDGFKDGYISAMKELGKLSPETIQKMMEEGAQLGYPRPW